MWNLSPGDLVVGGGRVGGGTFTFGSYPIAVTARQKIVTIRCHLTISKFAIS